MKKISRTFEYETHTTNETLAGYQKDLLNEAKENLENSYSPYSKFKVSAVILLTSGDIVKGTNQENMAYPSGMCAERVAIYYAMAKYPKAIIKSIAITAQTKEYIVNNPIPPCGACRQAMLEYELNQKSDIEIILQGEKGQIIVVDNVKDLMPLHFFESNLKS